VNAWEEVLFEGESEVRSYRLSAECQRLEAEFTRAHGREPDVAEERRLFDLAYREVYR